MNKWRGVAVNADDIDYDDRPWEIEAESIAHELYWKFNA